jgi:hypothetical protein
MAMVNKEYLLKAFDAFNDTEHAPKGWMNAMRTAREIVEDAPVIKAEKFGTVAHVVPEVLKATPEKITADLLKDFAVSMHAVGAITINKEYEPPTGLVRISIQTLPMVRGEGNGI